MPEFDVTTALTGIKYVSPQEQSGYGVAARQYMRSLHKMGIPITWTPMTLGMSWGLGYEPFQGKHTGDSEFNSFYNRRIEYDVVVVQLLPNFYPKWVEREPDKKIIGITVWETDKIPDHWLPLLNTVDLLIVPCQWNKQVFEACGVARPIKVVPYIYENNQKIFNSNKLWGIPGDDYVFYTINQWNERKALWKTLECYLNTFTAQDATTLVIKTTKEDLTKFQNRRRWKYITSRFKDNTKRAVREIMQKYPSPARVKLIDWELSREEMMRLHQRGDCYVSLTRSEGWGLGAYDAAGLGKPVIITGFGGQLDFLPKELTFLVDYTLIPAQAGDYYPYSPDQKWAEPDLKQASKFMRHVFENQEDGQNKGQQLERYIHENFNEQIVTKKLVTTLESVL